MYTCGSSVCKTQCVRILESDVLSHVKHLTKTSKCPCLLSGHDWGKTNKQTKLNQPPNPHHLPHQSPCFLRELGWDHVKSQCSVHYMSSLSQFCLSDNANCVPVVMNSLLCIQGETLKNWALKGCLSTLDLVMSDKNRGTRRSLKGYISKWLFQHLPSPNRMIGCIW